MFGAPCGTFPIKSVWRSRAIAQERQQFMSCMNSWTNSSHYRLYFCINRCRMKRTITDASCIRINPTLTILSMFCAPCCIFLSKSVFCIRAIAQERQQFMSCMNSWTNSLHYRLYFVLTGAA